MFANGFGRVKVSDGTASDNAPSWSRDGKKIMFASCCLDDFSIETMNADGTGRTELTSSLDFLGDTDWASDGSYAYDEELNCINQGYQGGSVHLSTFGDLTPCSDDGLLSALPSWSPDAQRVAYLRSECSFCAPSAIYTIKRDGTDPQPLTTPPAGGDRNPVWSPDGSKIAFDRGGRIHVMNSDGTGIVDITDGIQPDWQPTFPGYIRPKTAGPLRVSLVPAYSACTAPNRTHGPSLAFGSCNPPAQTSPNLAVGTPDANGATANSIGFVKITPYPGIPGPPEDSGAIIQMSTSDVRCQVVNAPPTCTPPNAQAGGDYVGEVQLDLELRITDKWNASGPGGGSNPATVEDISYPITGNCTSTSDIQRGSSCSIATDANAVVPGSILDTKRTVWAFDQVRVFDGGPDGDVDTANNSVFEVQGLFIP
jgi:hypothetical protein